MKKLLMGLVLVNLLAACASDPVQEETAQEPAATTESTATAAPETGAADNAPVATESTTAAQPQAQTAAAAEDAAPGENSVYFPFDVDSVQAADRATVQAHGKYLSAHRGMKVRLEGNADERGSSEYNLGLGQRRANNVKKLLVLSGAKESQITTVSYGEEKPRCSAHEESCWSQNRRVDFVYSGK
jgi:peptidoglycan-associated lipoprotein